MGRGVLVVALTLVAGTRVSGQDALRPYVVAVWSETGNSAKTGVILPFADFDGQRWRSSWHTPIDTSDGASAPPPLRQLRNIPATWWGPSDFQPTWEMLDPSGRRRSFQVTGTRWTGLGSSCSASVGLATDVPANVYGYQPA